MVYEWDEEKYLSNIQKHGVRFEVAKDVWSDQMAIEYLDADTSDDEQRFIRIGFTEFDGFLTVVFCERAEGQVIRIISVRKSTKKEKGAYARRV